MKHLKNKIFLSEFFFQNCWKILWIFFTVFTLPPHILEKMLGRRGKQFPLFTFFYWKSIFKFWKLKETVTLLNFYSPPPEAFQLKKRDNRKENMSFSHFFLFFKTFFPLQYSGFFSFMLERELFLVLLFSHFSIGIKKTEKVIK